MFFSYVYSDGMANPDLLSNVLAPKYGEPMVGSNTCFPPEATSGCLPSGCKSRLIKIE
jgi:hypothetical protein